MTYHYQLCSHLFSRSLFKCYKLWKNNTIPTKLNKYPTSSNRTPREYFQSFWGDPFLEGDHFAPYEKAISLDGSPSSSPTSFYVSDLHCKSGEKPLGKVIDSYQT